MAYFYEPLNLRGFLVRLPPRMSRRSRRRVLDIRALSDHLKRDMGFLDGVPTGKQR